MKPLVELFGDPDIHTREVLPYDSEETVKDKNKRPFQAKDIAVIRILYKNKIYFISNDLNYKYDGASIPFKIGKGNMQLLIPSMFHDIMCEDKSLIDYDRKLSSMVFKELLIQCKVNKLTAEIMYLAVDNYQRFMKGWKK